MNLVAETGARTDQGVDLAVLSENIQPAERGDHALLDPSIDAFVLDDLKILILPGTFGADEHRQLRVRQIRGTKKSTTEL